MDKLRKIRRKNYKYEKRKTNILKVDYPIRNLDYKTNVYNQLAQKFYEDRGCFLQEKALEAQKNATDKEVMISKYCIKKQLGMCSKQTSIKKYAEPFVLIDEFNKEYLVEFNCKDCVMKLRTGN